MIFPSFPGFILQGPLNRSSRAIIRWGIVRVPVTSDEGYSEVPDNSLTVVKPPFESLRASRGKPITISVSPLIV